VKSPVLTISHSGDRLYPFIAQYLDSERNRLN